MEVEKLDSQSCYKCSKPKNAEFFCDFCDYVTSRKSNYQKHLLTKKHRMLTNANIKVAKHLCECGRAYAQRSSLSRHQKACEPRLAKLFKDMEDAQQQIKALTMQGSNVTIVERVEVINFQVFLNDKCRDALTMEDYIQRIEHEQVMFSSGPKDRMLSLLVDKIISPIKPTARPFHCTDVHKPEFMVKARNKGWEVDDGIAVVRSTEKAMNRGLVAALASSGDGLSQADYIRISQSVCTRMNPAAQRRLAREIGERLHIKEVMGVCVPVHDKNVRN